MRLQDGRVFKSRVVISNATRWDTFDTLLANTPLPAPEKAFRTRFVKAPSFFTMHVGIKAECLRDAEGRDPYCHHIVLEDWKDMYDARGTLFLSIPSTLDPSVAPEGRHLLHAFTPDWHDAWKDLSGEAYQQAKKDASEKIITRLEAIFPKIREGIEFMEVGTPRTHYKFLNRVDGTYGPVPSRSPRGMLSMPFNTTAIQGLYCAGDSTFPGQGVNAVVFSGFGAAHRIAVDLGYAPGLPKVGDLDLDHQFNRMLNYLRDTA